DNKGAPERFRQRWRDHDRGPFAPRCKQHLRRALERRQERGFHDRTQRQRHYCELRSAKWHCTILRLTCVALALPVCRPRMDARPGIVKCHLVRLDLGEESARSGRAWLVAAFREPTSPDAKNAVEPATKACEFSSMRNLPLFDHPLNRASAF